MLLSSHLSITEMIQRDFPCECGRTHLASINYAAIGEGVLKELPGLLLKNSLQKSFILCDSSTYAAAGKFIVNEMKNRGLPFVSYIINEAEPVPDEKTLGELLIHMDHDCDHIIAVGSGTINDLSRFLSFRLGLPYIIAATAPSMDGFASNVAPLIVKHMKTTYEAHAPFAIFGDTSVLAKAPLLMIFAGIGDILGKYTCLCDWRVSHILTGEYHCKIIEAIVKQSIETVVSQLEHVKSGDPGAVENIMEALVLSGIAMSFSGNSRPASGSEHHLSHYWEMVFLFNGKKPVLHGTKVGIGTIAVIRAYELLLSRNIDFKRARELAKMYSFDDWKQKMRAAYGPASDSVIALEEKLGKNRTSDRLMRIDLIEKHWDRLKEVIGQLPSADTVYDYLSELGAPATPMAVGIDKQTFLVSFAAAKELRNRFGLLQILYDLNLSEETAELVWDYFMNK